MSEKQNFSIHTELLENSSAESISGQITRALKLAYDYPDDFIRCTRALRGQIALCNKPPVPTDLVKRGKLSYNLLADFGGVKLFFSKGTDASFKNGCLTIYEVILAITRDTILQWQDGENDFNADGRYILLKPYWRGVDE